MVRAEIELGWIRAPTTLRNDRAAVLSRFVGTLSDDDERLLSDLLRHINEAGGTDSPR